MKAFERRAAVSAAALLVALGTAQAAEAAVTAQQVWDDWKAQIETYGEGAVTVGGESAAGGVLTVTDLAISTTAEDGTVVEGSIPQIVFTENGDGTVSVSSPDEYPFTISSPANAETGQPATDVSLAIRQSGMTMTVSGDPGALSYDIAAARYAIELDGVVQDGVEMPGEAMLALNDVAGTYTSATGGMRSMAYDLAAGSLDLLLDVTSPSDGSHVTLSGQLQDMAFQAAIESPLDMTTSPETLLMDGLAAAGGYSSGPAQYIFEFTDATGPTSGTLQTGGSEVTFDVSGEGISYDASARALALEATSAQMPFPISASVAEYGVNATIPAAAMDTPQDWALGVNLTDLAINEEIWAMVDPQAMLSHDPATLIVDLSGTATLLFDLFDPAQQEAMAAAPMPGTVESVSLNDLNVSIGGAQVTGTGAFTLDNADMTTFPGMPRPEGVAEFQMNGVNALIDDLVAMGLLPQEQVMGARMMLGLLAVPVGEDQLTSRIEVNAEGQLLANGQRLQ